MGQQPSRKALHVYLEPETHQALFAETKELGITATAFIEAVLQHRLGALAHDPVLIDLTRGIMATRQRERWEK